jgi:hypothetical protein
MSRELGVKREGGYVGVGFQVGFVRSFEVDAIPKREQSRSYTSSRDMINSPSKQNK